jgi:bis(5'-nucleosyl)-tetraphosphatase (symmetrical)
MPTSRLNTVNILAIGDLQGCYEPFRRLLDKAAFDPGQDRLWLVGDLVNRGPRNLETLRFVKSLGAAATMVLGNHDLYLLMLAAGFGKRQHDDTLGDVLQAPDRDELLFWLRQQPLMHVEAGYALVHAGLLPGWTAPKARALAGEVEAWLRGDDYRELLGNLWGSEPAAWDDALSGWGRYRVIVNAMTRMRFCNQDGVMDLRVKGELKDAPPGYMPWFAVPGRCSADTPVICGHWSALGLVVEPTLLALDSGCLWGRELSGIRLPERAVVQVDCGCGAGAAPGNE